MEPQTNLETLGIGDKESVTLKPAIVKIVSHEVKNVSKDAKPKMKLICSVKHPDKEETIMISSVKYEQKQTLKSVGLWVNLDEDGKLRKGSSLAHFLTSIGCENVSQVDGKEVVTTEDESGYLTFKAY